MTTYYVDFNRGDDGNNGTSAASAWKNITKIDDAAKSAGDSILLASDSIWSASTTWNGGRIVPPTSWAGTEKSPIVIGKYDPASAATKDKPTIIWHHDTAASDWTETATSNVWLYANAGGFTFTNSCFIRLGDTWDASAVDAQNTAALIGSSGVDGRYYATSTTLWLYAPENPVNYFGSVKVSPGAAGYFTLSTNRNWVTIQDLHFEETGCGVLLYSGGAGVASYTAKRISGRTVSNFIAANADSGGNLRAWIDSCSIVDFGALGIISGGAGGFSQVEITNNRIDRGVRCWAQGGIYMVGRTGGFSALVQGNHISNCAWGTRDKSLDGCGIYTENGSDAVRVLGNRIEDCYVAIQDNSGRSNTFSANVVRNCRIGMRITDQGGNNAMNHYAYNNTFVVGDQSQVPSEFGGTQGQQYTGFWIYRPTGTAVVTAKNNIIADMSGTGSAAFGLPEVSGTFSLDGNWIYGYQYDTQRTETPGTTGSLTNLGETNPDIGTRFLPANLSCYDVATAVGVRDFYGNEFPNPCNAGAVQDWQARNMTTRSAASRSCVSRLVSTRRSISGV